MYCHALFHCSVEFPPPDGRYRGSEKLLHRGNGLKERRELHMRKTKIVCTIGPASESEEVLRELILAGADVVRFNFSHATALLGNISLSSPFTWKIQLAPLNAGGVPVWKTVESGMTAPEEPGGTADTIILPTDIFELDPAEYPIGTYWMTVEFSDTVNWTRTFPFTLQII